MGAAYFYHLTRQPLEATLPMLLEKSLGAGWRGGDGMQRGLPGWMSGSGWGQRMGFCRMALLAGCKMPISQFC